MSVGDDTTDLQWVTLDKLQELLNTRGCFSDVDRAAALFYLKDKVVNHVE